MYNIYSRIRPMMVTLYLVLFIYRLNFTPNEFISDFIAFAVIANEYILFDVILIWWKHSVFSYYLFLLFDSLGNMSCRSFDVNPVNNKHEPNFLNVSCLISLFQKKLYFWICYYFIMLNKGMVRDVIESYTSNTIKSACRV